MAMVRLYLDTKICKYFETANNVNEIHQLKSLARNNDYPRITNLFTILSLDNSGNRLTFAPQIRKLINA